VSWQDDGDGFQRAVIEVPYDYADPGGRTFPLTAVRLPAGDPAGKLGTLFVNFGGPGGGAAVVVRQFGRGLFPAPVLQRYDVVGVDPRGTGDSLPVQCLGTTAQIANFPFVRNDDFPETGAERVAGAAQSLAYGSECRRRNGDLLDHVGTLQFARDLDVLRAALGDSRINLVGYSYGTFLGQVVANVFPARAGRLVLDGLQDPDWASGTSNPISELRAYGDLGSWQTAQEFFRRCDSVGPERCAFAGRSELRFAELAERLRREPVVVPVDGGTLSVGYSELILQTVGALYDDQLWGQLAEILAGLEATRPTAVAGALRAVRAALSDGMPRGAALPEGYDNVPDAAAAVLCGDTDNPRDPFAYGRIGQQRDHTVAPYFGSKWAYEALRCAGWLGRSTERWIGPWNRPTANTVLLIGNRFDPATPYRNAQRVAQLLPNSRLLTLDGVGHTSRGTSGCVLQYETDYLLTGATPAPGTVCPQDVVPFTPTTTS
jgi:pimeloyl-ACP methyl ester carboxylesterase